jgi:hypothetical protein
MGLPTITRQGAFDADAAKQVNDNFAAGYAVTAYPADGAIAIGVGAGLIALTKPSAGAYTLAAPTAAQAGTELTITAGTAFAHVITATGLIDDGITGGSKNTMTFAAFVGASITLRAYNLKWVVISKNVVTVA